MLLCAFILSLELVSTTLQYQIQRRDGDLMHELLAAAIDYLKLQTFKSDPMKLPDVRINSTKVYLNGLMKANVTITNSKYSGFSVFMADYEVTDLKRLKGHVRLTYPELSIAGDYNIEGLIFGLRVKGSDHYQFQVDNFTWTFRNVQLHETDKKALRVGSFGLSMDVADFSVVTPEIQAEGMNDSAIMQLMKQSLAKSIQSFAPRFAWATEAAYLRLMNSVIGNRSLEEAIQWLKDHKDDDGDLMYFITKYEHRTSR